MTEITIDNRNVIRVTRSTVDGRDRVDIRTWFEAQDGTIRPSQRGFGVRPKQAWELVKALREELGHEK